MNLNLTDEQKRVYSHLLGFLHDPNKQAIIIDGSGGVGKSFMVNYICNNLIEDYKCSCQISGKNPEYRFIIPTATTNKACESLSQYLKTSVQTIHNYLGLVVFDDYETGETSVVPSRSYRTRHNEVILIDEASMINKVTFEYIKKALLKEDCNCKVIYVGDKYQLPPVKEDISQVYLQGYEELSLTKLLRASNQELININKAAKQLVIDGTEIPVKEGLNVHFLDDTSAPKYIVNNFKNPDHNNLICCYTNKSVIAYNNYCKQIRGITTPYVKGEHYVCNNVVHMSDSNHENLSVIFHVEDECKITNIDFHPQQVKVYENNTVEAYRAEIENLSYGSKFVVYLPTDINKHLEQIKLIKKQAMQDKELWRVYYAMKNFFPDMRPRDAKTIHKAQGSSVEDVFIDLNDLSHCYDKNVTRRLLYVAISRARKNVYFYGELPNGYLKL